ncbi:MAG: hypothetical protein ACFFBV_14630 [Promethearchaeota archaeon]
MGHEGFAHRFHISRVVVMFYGLTDNICGSLGRCTAASHISRGPEGLCGKSTHLSPRHLLCPSPLLQCLGYRLYIPVFHARCITIGYGIPYLVPLGPFLRYPLRVIVGQSVAGSHRFHSSHDISGLNVLGHSLKGLAHDGPLGQSLPLGTHDGLMGPQNLFLPEMVLQHEASHPYGLPFVNANFYHLPGARLDLACSPIG